MPKEKKKEDKNKHMRKKKDNKHNAKTGQRRRTQIRR